MKEEDLNNLLDGLLGPLPFNIHKVFSLVWIARGPGISAGLNKNAIFEEGSTNSLLRSRNVWGDVRGQFCHYGGDTTGMSIRMAPVQRLSTHRPTTQYPMLISWTALLKENLGMGYPGKPALYFSKPEPKPCTFIYNTQSYLCLIGSSSLEWRRTNKSIIIKPKPTIGRLVT